MAMDLKEIERHIKEALPDASIEIQDLAGDNNHYSATITSAKASLIKASISFKSIAIIYSYNQLTNLY